MILTIIISLILYYSVFKKVQWQFLLFLSLAFYAYFEKGLVAFILITAISIYFAAIKIERIENRQEDDGKHFKKVLLVSTLVLNFLILFAFKYLGLFAGTLTKLFINTWANEAFFISIVVPLGISFYTFKSTAYLIDVYRNKYSPEANFFKLLFFVSYFPALLQGPIDKFDELAKTLYKRHEIDYELFNKGALLILFGMMKKFLIADKLAPYVNDIVGSYTNYSGGILFFTMFIFGIQIYSDFSGGIDIVRGVSYLFGIRLANNFNSPYLATSLADYWRRWHMTLGAWMREYVFYPMSLSQPFMSLNVRARKKFGRDYGKIFSLMISTLVVYLLIGLWHGSRAISALFGIYYGVLISLSLLLKPLRKKLDKKIKMSPFIKYPLQLFWVNILVSIGRYFSKANTPKELYEMLKWTVLNFTVTSGQESLGFFAQLKKLYDLDNLFLVLPLSFSLIMLIIIGIIRERKNDIYIYITEQMPRAVTFGAIFTVLVFVIVFAIIYGDFTDIRFVYMQY